MPQETNHQRDKQKKTDDEDDDDDDDVSGDTRIRQWSGLLTSAEPSQSPDHQLQWVIARKSLARLNLTLAGS